MGTLLAVVMIGVIVVGGALACLRFGGRGDG